MWRVVWQQHSARIVMVTNLVEKGKVCITIIIIITTNCAVS